MAENPETRHVTDHVIDHVIITWEPKICVSLRILFLWTFMLFGVFSVFPIINYFQWKILKNCLKLAWLEEP